MATKHDLIIDSRHDAQAHCSCGHFRYVATGEMDDESVAYQFNAHKNNKRDMAKSDERETAIWMQPDEDRAEGDCGCVLVRNFGGSDDPAIIFCSTHDAAYKMKQALTAMRGAVAKYEDDPDLDEAKKLTDKALGDARMHYPSCDGTNWGPCSGPVTHIDKAGFVYCTAHGLHRREYEPCRKLRQWELRRLQRGEQLNCY